MLPATVTLAETMVLGYHAKMMDAMNTDLARLPPICGADLECWRVEHDLSKSTAAEMFGLQRARWDMFISDEYRSRPIPDLTVAMLLHLYRTHPESVPKNDAVDVKKFYYESIGLTDSSVDRGAFAKLIGRSTPSVYRMMLHDAKPSGQVARLIEAVKRIKLPPNKTQRGLMESIASHVRQRQKNERAATC